jgi:hypothetical protein
MGNTNEPSGGNDQSTPAVNDCYTAEEVAKILGLKKEAILKRCRMGKLTGAFKAEPTATVPAGQWFIPKNSIDQPAATQEMFVIPRPMTQESVALLIRQSINQGINEQLTAAINPLHDEIKALREEIGDLKKQLQERAALPAPEEEKPWWRFW